MPRQSTKRATPSSRDMESAERAYRRAQERQREATESLTRRAGKIAEAGRRRLHDLVGAKKLAELRAAIGRERLHLRALRQPPDGVMRDHEKDRQAAKRRIDAIVKKLGLRIGKVRKIQEETRDELKGLLTATGRDPSRGYELATHLDRWKLLTGRSPDSALVGDLETAPDEGDPNDPHRWFWYTAPFSRLTTKLHTAPAPSYLISPDYISTPGGWLGSELDLDNFDSTDEEWGFAMVDSAVRFWFDPPTAGRLQVVIHAQCLRDLYEVSVEDEWGFSAAWTHQRNHLYMETWGAEIYGRSSARMSRIDLSSDGDDRSWSIEHLIPGKHYYADLISKDPANGNSSFLVDVGSNNWASAQSDDMEVHMRSIQMWVIHSVGMRIVP